LFQQPTGQTIAQLAGLVFTLGKSDQTVLAIAAEHLIERPAGLFLKLPTPLLKFFPADSRHSRSSLIAWDIAVVPFTDTAIFAPAILPRRRYATTVMHPWAGLPFAPARAGRLSSR